MTYRLSRRKRWVATSCEAAEVVALRERRSEYESRYSGSVPEGPPSFLRSSARWIHSAPESK
jgi:hypothetical protein